MKALLDAAMHSLQRMVSRPYAGVNVVALLRERRQLEARLLAIQGVLNEKGVRVDTHQHRCYCIEDSNSVSTRLAVAVGLPAESVRLLALVTLLFLLWSHGRSLVRSIAVLVVVAAIQVWACIRRLSRWLCSARPHKNGAMDTSFNGSRHISPKNFQG